MSDRLRVLSMSPPRLVLFTRYPEPGRAKTRLIPALGPEGAALLHQRLTEHCLSAMRGTGLPIEIRSTGGSLDAFRTWLGTDVTIVDQGEGDLGERLARASMEPPVVLLGADTPDLTTNRLTAAAEALTQTPAAIGPAEDGGYWALALSQPMPFLFADMPWSTEHVFALTCERLRVRGIVPAILDTLSDLDRPEDLDRFRSRFPDLQG